MDARPDIQGDDYGHGHECALVVPFGNCDPHGPAASPNACGPARDAVTVAWLLWLVPWLLALHVVAARAGEEVTGAPAGSYRAAQERGLDLSLDYDTSLGEEPDPVRGAPIGSFRAAQELPARVDWSRRVGKSWELDPVLLHRRQAGQPERPGDDLSNKTLGIELRRRF